MSLDTLMRGVTAVRTAQDYVKLPGYRNLSAWQPSRLVQEYRDEKAFWFDVLGYGDEARAPSAGDQIVLRGFRLSPWVARVPGLYWKAESTRMRAAAKGEMLPPGSLGVYTPVGKTMGILGGVGNVRLLPTGSGRLICASSSGEFYRGVPVFLQGEAWQAYADMPTGLAVDLRGVWTPIPREYAEAMGGNAGIPRYCLVVDRNDSLTPQGQVWPGRSSAWTLFERRDVDNRRLYDFSYCTFELDRSSSLRRPTEEDAHHVDEAASFLHDYVQSYHGQPLTDFDEEMPHFDAMLKVNELMSMQVDQARLRAFVDHVKKRALSPEAVQFDQLPQILTQTFSIEDLRALASDLKVELENLVGPTASKPDQVDALLAYCEQQDRLPELVTAAVELRPQVAKELAVPQ